ncbi:MAG: cytochrome c [Betaproteobacteria bacterium]|nr:cytochrome c [Betaproteobacteria bacterium]
MTRHPLLTACVFCATLSACQGVQGNPVAGKAEAVTCEACHGIGGNSTLSQYPRLAGQHASYIVQALTEYQTGQRTNPIMKAMAAGLTARTKANLAAYFASQRGLRTKY